MNVLMFTRYFGSGGTEKVILQLSDALLNNGDKPIVCSAAGKGVKHLYNKGITFYEIEDISSKNPFVMIRTAKLLYKIIRDEKIDIVHTHHRMAAFYIRALSIYKKIAFVNTIHNTFTDKKMLTKYAYEKARNIAVGSSVEENMVDFFHIPQASLVTINNAIDNNFVSQEDAVLESLRINGCFLVGNIGRINTQKGMEYFVRAVKILQNKGVKAKYVIVGEGVLEKQIKKLVVDLDLENVVFFYGFSDNVLNVMSKMDLIVLSSLWEGFPLTPIEAFAVGKTVIATDVPGTLEIVKDMENGIIVPKQNVEKLAEAIEKVLINPKLRISLEERAKDTYEKNFSIGVFWSKYQEIYLSLI